MKWVLIRTLLDVNRTKEHEHETERPISSGIGHIHEELEEESLWKKWAVYGILG